MEYFMSYQPIPRDASGNIPVDIINPLPTGANVIGNVGITSGTITSITDPVAVTGTFWQTTQPVSLSSLPISVSEATQLDVSSNTVSYLGKAAVGSSVANAVWKISLITSTSSGGLSIQFANGSASYNSIWNNRTSLTYL